MVGLITSDEAKRHLKVDSDDDDADVMAKALQAEAIIIDYIKKPDHEWTAETVPYVIKAAMLLMLGQLYADRENADITPPIKNLLHRSRDPAIA